MKRILTILILGLVLSLSCFSFVLAQERPFKCCKVKHNITQTIGGTTYQVSAGDIVKDPDATPENCPLISDPSEGKPQEHWALFCSLDAIMTIADLINAIAFIISGIVFGIAAILFFTAGGDPNKINKAKTFLLWGLVGVAVIVLSKFLPAFARFFLGI